MAARNMGAQALAAILEVDRLGRLTDKTREDLEGTLAEHSGGRAVEVDDKGSKPGKDA